MCEGVCLGRYVCECEGVCPRCVCMCEGCVCVCEGMCLGMYVCECEGVCPGCVCMCEGVCLGVYVRGCCMCARVRGWPG